MLTVNEDIIIIIIMKVIGSRSRS